MVDRTRGKNGHAQKIRGQKKTHCISIPSCSPQLMLVRFIIVIDPPLLEPSQSSTVDRSLISAVGRSAPVAHSPVPVAQPALVAAFRRRPSQEFVDRPLVLPKKVTSFSDHSITNPVNDTVTNRAIPFHSRTIAKHWKNDRCQESLTHQIVDSQTQTLG